MAQRHVGWGIAVLMSLWGLGCDDGVPPDLDAQTAPRVTMVLGQRAPVDTCASSLATVVLAVTSGGSTQTQRQTVMSDTLTFNVSGVPQGDVRFDVAVLSNTSDTLFTGQAAQTITTETFPPLTIRLEKQRPVLEVCPDATTLVRTNEGAYEATFEVNNRHRDADASNDRLDWQAEDVQCAGGTCVNVQPPGGTATEGAASTLTVQAAPPVVAAEVPVTVRSAYGTATVLARIVPGANRPPRFASTPDTTATIGSPYTYIVMTVDPDGDPVAIRAGGPGLPAWLALTDNDDGTAVLAGTPPEDAAASIAVELLADDGVNPPVVQAFAIAVVQGVRAVPDDAVLNEDDADGVYIDVLVNDQGSNFQLISVGQPARGSVEQEGNGLRYIPNPDATGQDEFSYTIEDASGNRSSALVGVFINPCIDFDALEIGMAYSAAQDENPIYTEHTVGVEIAELPPDSSDSGVAITVNAQTVAAIGRGVAIAFDLGTFRFPLDQAVGVDPIRYVRFEVRNSNSDIYLAINESRFRGEGFASDSFGEFREVLREQGIQVSPSITFESDEFGSIRFDAQAAATIRTVWIGGVSVFVDNVCFGARAPSP